VQAIPKVENTRYFEDLINSALSPDPAGRPTAVALREALFGKGAAGKPDSVRPPPSPSPSPSPTLPPPPPPPPTSGFVELAFEGKAVLKMGIDTVVGRALLKPISADAQFASDTQFRIHRSASKEWMVSPIDGAQNETIVDGAKLTAPTRLRHGMRLAIGNSAKGIEKLPLIVRMV